MGWKGRAHVLPSYLRNHSLINALAAHLEGMCLYGDGDQAILPPKISPVLPGSQEEKAVLVRCRYLERRDLCKPRHGFLSTGAELTRPCLVNIGSTSNHAASRLHVPLNTYEAEH
jgi:hypothetical protein